MSKLYCEQYLTFATRDMAMDCTSIRLSNPFGRYHPSRKNQGVINIAIKKALSGDYFEVFGDASKIKKDYIHMDSVSETMEILINTDFSGLLNIGSGTETSLKEILSCISGIQDSFKPLIIQKSAQSYDNRQFSLDTTLMKSVTQNKIAYIPIEKGIAELYDWQNLFLQSRSDEFGPF